MSDPLDAPLDLGTVAKPLSDLAAGDTAVTAAPEGAELGERAGAEGRAPAAPLAPALEGEPADGALVPEGALAMGAPAMGAPAVAALEEALVDEALDAGALDAGALDAGALEEEALAALDGALAAAPAGEALAALLPASRPWADAPAVLSSSLVGPWEGWGAPSDGGA